MSDDFPPQFISVYFVVVMLTSKSALIALWSALGVRPVRHASVTKDVKICSSISFDVRDKMHWRKDATYNYEIFNTEKTNLHIICSLNCKRKRPRCNLLHRGLRSGFITGHCFFLRSLKILSPDP